MDTMLIHVGFGNYVATGRIVAIASPKSAPTKRLIQDGRDKGKVIDLTGGRKTKSVVVSDSGHFVLVALDPSTVDKRINESV